MKKDNYERDHSHTHCWNQTSPACGQPLEKHTQCCLCSAVPEKTENIQSDLNYKPSQQESDKVRDKMLSIISNRMGIKI